MTLWDMLGLIEQLLVLINRRMKVFQTVDINIIKRKEYVRKYNLKRHKNEPNI